MRTGDVSNIKNLPPPTHTHKYSTDLQKKYDLRNHSKFQLHLHPERSFVERKTIILEGSFFTDSVRYGGGGENTET